MSRFPLVTETFIVRELDALVSLHDVDVELRALFPAPEGPVHDLARPWARILRRPRPAAVLRGLLWAVRHHPRALLVAVAAVVTDHRRVPGLMVRALLTVAIACAHAREMEGSGTDRVHAHFATYPALAAWVCRRLTGIPYSFTVHAHDLFVDRSMLGRKIGEADVVITISEFNKRLLEQGTSGTPVEVVRCGVRTDHYAFRPRRIPSSGAVRALCVASLQEYKGHRTLLEAIARGGACERLELELIGDGPQRDELEHLAGRLGLAARVRFSGAQPEHLVRQALERADLFVLPSVVARDGQMEGLPVVLLEALASGVPTVSTRLSGIPEIVVDGRTGLLAEPADIDDLHRVLEKVLAGGGDAIEWARAGRELVETEFELNRNVARLAGILA
ncbi:glycosyltransferase [Pseudonocardia charpentierae]|uniref:Glycosyltransferase n=1 Tax=Pseudonocardia charpentierae TaxID=3075545 RepID=A0ABU2NLM0_9PSEU|nr:glycosyltransferase [Pseudonocardia sp. DSM 45834]MDT0353514.1 glycosyltransferase [Pseudonocardia sp. DSM 45834]